MRSLVYLKALLPFLVLFGCLTLPASCRLGYGKMAPVVSSAMLDESKIYIVFCLPAYCNRISGKINCYCCGNVHHQQSCHQTLEECKAKCPLCNPH
ncbi:hypothetical protein EJB05_35616, partial [Eragrostis curvula]